MLTLSAPNGERGILPDLLKGHHNEHIKSLVEAEDGTLVGETIGSYPLITLDAVDIPTGPRHDVIVELESRYEPTADSKEIPPSVRVRFRLAGSQEFEEEYTRFADFIPPGVFQTHALRFRTLTPNRITGIQVIPTTRQGTFQIRRAMIRSQERRPTIWEGRTYKFALIASCGRVGSTLFTNLLSMHPEIMTNTMRAAEAFILTYFAKFYGQIKRTPLWQHQRSAPAEQINAPYVQHTGVHHPIGVQDGLDIELLREHYGSFVREYIPKLIASCQFPYYSNATYYLEKAWLPWINEIVELFPEIKCVLLFRDPRTRVRSVIRYDQKYERSNGDVERDGLAAHVHRMMKSYKTQLHLITHDPEERNFL
ncbi:MAG: sulfotransferase, partial [Myxococcales bacterium]|nr:sulfotransferase [Myxococcales bacterium]